MPTQDTDLDFSKNLPFLTPSNEVQEQFASVPPVQITPVFKLAADPPATHQYSLEEVYSPQSGLLGLGNPSQLAQGQTVSVAAVAVMLTAAYFYKKSLAKKEKQPATQPKTLEEHKGVIRYQAPGQEKLEKSTDRQAARARPNQRLVSIFGINNAFTTMNYKFKQEFKEKAVAKMQGALGISRKTYRDTDGNWTILRQLARQSVDQMLTGQSKIRLVDLIRVATLRVSMRFLFNTPLAKLADAENNQELSDLGQMINNMWIESKGDVSQQSSWKDPVNARIHALLEEYCVADEADEADKPDPRIPSKNPMNWILPAYETMWRSVVHFVIELYFRDAPNASIWRESLATFVDNPTRASFKDRPDPSNTNIVSPRDIVKEIFRLYPPSRHIHRQFEEGGEVIKANIEACHRSKLQFGADALTFRPERWQEMRRRRDVEEDDDKHIKVFEERCGFIPFAFVCPASTGDTQAFGYKVVTLLAGVICEQLEREPSWDLSNKKAYRNRKAPLPSGRADFDRVYLERTHGHNSTC